MPDKSDSTTTINPVPVTPNLPSMDSDVPPPPAPEPVGGAGPTNDLQGLGIPPVITPTKPGRRVNRRMVATILGLFVLVGGLGAGLILVRQQQDIREKAAGCSGACALFNCNSGYHEIAGDCTQGSDYVCCAADTVTSTPIPPTSTPSSWGSQCRSQGGECVFETTLCGQELGTVDCDGGNYKCCITGTVETPTPLPTQDNGCAYCPAGYAKAPVGSCGEKNPPASSCYENGVQYWCCPIGSTPKATPTAPPPPPPDQPQYQCQNVKAYNTDWKLLTAEQLATLKAGDKVRFTISGTATAGTIDKAAFQINGGPDQETSQKKPADNEAKFIPIDEYYIEYTIPAGTTSFNVTAKLHHSTLGWF